MCVDVYFKRAPSARDAIIASRSSDSVLDIKNIFSLSGNYCYKVTHMDINPPLELLVVVSKLFEDVYRVEVDIFPN